VAVASGVLVVSRTGGGRVEVATVVTTGVSVVPGEQATRRVSRRIIENLDFIYFINIQFSFKICLNTGQ
jgi:hypothetical protein